MNSRILLWFAVGALALAGLFVWLKPPPSAPAPPVTAPAAAKPAEPVTQTIELAVQDGRLVSGPELIQAMQGQPIRLRITSNKADELHLHGYDLSLKLKPGVPAELNFTANLSGRFEYELHHAHAALGVLEVQPRTL